MKKESAFPVQGASPSGGLTKMEYFAGIAFQAMIDKYEWKQIEGSRNEENRKICVAISIELADELLKQLEQ